MELLPFIETEIKGGTKMKTETPCPECSYPLEMNLVRKGGSWKARIENLRCPSCGHEERVPSKAEEFKLENELILEDHIGEILEFEYCNSENEWHKDGEIITHALIEVATMGKGFRNCKLA